MESDQTQLQTQTKIQSGDVPENTIIMPSDVIHVPIHNRVQFYPYNMNQIENENQIEKRYYHIKMDESMIYDDKNINIRDYFLKNKKYKYCTNHIEQHTQKESELYKRYEILNKYSLCSDPYLIVTLNASITESEIKCTINNMFEKFRLMINKNNVELIIDTIYGANICELISLYKKSINLTMNNFGNNGLQLKIPLPFDLLVGTNLLPLFDLNKSELYIDVILNTKCPILNKIQLFMKYYKLRDYNDKSLHGIMYGIPSNDMRNNERQDFCIPINQTQYTGSEPLIVNYSYLKYKLMFNNPIRMLYFYFSDDKCNRININVNVLNIQFNGHDIF